MTMKVSVYTLTSAISDPKIIEQNSKEFLDDIAQAAHCDFDIKGEDFSDYNEADMPVIFIRTGGTEGKFKDVFSQLKGNICLLTSGMSNSLAASMEILSFLRQQGRQGRILHGSTTYIAKHLQMDFLVEQACKKLNGARYGVIGKPSDWLISSDVNREVLQSKLGIEFIDIKIDELHQAYQQIDDESPEWKELMAEQVARDFDEHAPQCLVKYKQGAFKIYLALKQVVDKYRLNGFTLRCFDMLSLVHNTGCMALAMFNAQGIPASCEGDTPALLTMAIGQALTGYTGFMANPSRINVDTDEITFAHCTVPMNMVKSYSYDTHFESGIGIGLKGEFAKSRATIAKIAGDLERSWFCETDLVDNLSECNLCRTQIVLHGKGFADYFLTNPIGNHHIIFQGNQAELFKAFMKHLSCI